MGTHLRSTRSLSLWRAILALQHVGIYPERIVLSKILFLIIRRYLLKYCLPGLRIDTPSQKGKSHAMKGSGPEVSVPSSQSNVYQKLYSPSVPQPRADCWIYIIVTVVLLTIKARYAPDCLLSSLSSNQIFTCIRAFHSSLRALQQTPRYLQGSSGTKPQFR